MHTTAGRRAPRRHTIARPRGLLGTRLQTARRARGLTQTQLAARSGATVATIGKLECGDVTAPRMATIAAVARVLDIAPSWLLSSDPDASGGP